MGETKRVTFTLTSRDLSLVTEQGEHVVMPGDYKVFVGSSQPGAGGKGAEASFQTTGEVKLPR